MFTRGFIDFFKDLAGNNHKEWFHANKKRYEAEVKKPWYAFVQTLIDEMKKLDADFDLEVKNAVFRINRDIRFSKDKNPYKNHVGAVISRGGRKDMQNPGLYVHAEVEKFWIAGGAYCPDKENLHKIRTAIMNNKAEAESILGEKNFKKVFGGLADSDRNKILPKDFKEAAKENDLLFNKQFYFSAAYDGETTILREDLVDFTMSHYHTGLAWNEFIQKALR